MDRREILILKPDAVMFRNRCIYGNYSVLGKRVLRRSFLITIDAITYAIQIKRRYLKLKEHSEVNRIQPDIPIKMRRIGSTVIFTCTCGQTITFEYKK